MDREEFAWRLYESERDFIKHHENQRTNASSILAATAAALMVAFTAGPADPASKLIIAVTLMVIGLFGSIFSGKLYELIQLHANRSYKYLDYVNEAFPEIDVKSVKQSVKAAQKKKFRFFASISLNRIWFNFHLLVFAFGLTLTAVTAAHVYGLS